MTLRLRLRLLMSALLGTLLVVAVGSALQFREISTLAQDVIRRDVALMQAVLEMERLLGEDDRGAEFDEAFREQLQSVVDAETSEEAQAAAQAVLESLDAWDAAPGAAPEETEVRARVADLGTIIAAEADGTADVVSGEATTAAVGLGILGAAVVVIGAWVTRFVRTSLIDRLIAIDAAITAIRRGESTRRVGLAGDDELGRVAAALDAVLDLRDQTDSAMQGRNAELRAMLVAMLKRWPRPAAITGIDGEIIVSTLGEEQEAALRSVTPQLRKAARTLLSRKFLSASELETDLRVDAAHAFAIKALALGEQRIVGWIADVVPPRSEIGAGARS